MAPALNARVIVVATSCGLGLIGCGGAQFGPITPAMRGLVYEANVGGTFGIQRAFDDGSDSATVTAAAGGFFASLSRDGDMAFVLNGDIYLLPAAGGPAVQLTTDPALDTRPIISFDGTRIVFASERDGNREIYIMNANGTGQTRLTNDPAQDYFPNLNRTGTKIAFMSTRDGNDEIYVMNADGTGVGRLTNDPGGDTTPAFSPDGGRIVFSSDRGGQYDLYRMFSSNGSGIERLTNTVGQEEFHPSYHVNAVQIYYEVDPIGAGSNAVWRMHFSGANQAPVPLAGIDQTKVGGWVF